MEDEDTDIFSLGLRLEAVAFHRNGVGGAPFHVVLFEGDSDPMLGIVFEKQYYVAVLQREKLAKGDIAFRSNSWRGDVYEYDLRRAIGEWEEAQNRKFREEMTKEDAKQ